MVLLHRVMTLPAQRTICLSAGKLFQSRASSKAVASHSSSSAWIGASPRWFSLSSSGSSSAFSTSTQEGRPFQILGLQQIALGSLDKASLQTLWTDIFGLNKVGSFKSEQENVDEDVLHLGKADSPFAVEVDLMAPLDPEKSPKVHVPPLNHFGLWVDDLEAAVEWMTMKGSCQHRCT